MNHNEAFALLNDYLDADLTFIQRRDVENHLRNCNDCRTEVEELRALRNQASSLPREITPRRDLWPAIHSKITAPSDSSLKRTKGPVPWLRRGAAIAATIAIAIGSFWLSMHSSRPAWQVAALEGTPRVSSAELGEKGMIRVGEVLETDDASRAKVFVGIIGQVDVEPRSRLRLLTAKTTDHRLALDVGTIHARIYAPPRLFFVETPSGTAIDLGCEYVLHVAENGSGRLEVTSGWVAIELAGRESIIPAGAVCETRPGIGPGTPYKVNASETFRRALRDFDFSVTGSEVLDRILASAQQTDAISLWHLIPRTSGADREQVVHTLMRFVPLPPTVTREGIIAGDRTMMQEWFDEFGVRGPWWMVWQ